MTAKRVAKEVALVLVSFWFAVAAAAILGMVCKALWVAFHEGWRLLP